MGDITYIDPGRKKITELAAGHSDAIHCLLISISDETILLPNAAVAEVIGYTKPEPLDGSPNWFLGRVAWRERLVPLISLEIATLAADSANLKQGGTRIAVLNTLNANPNVPYIGIVSQGIPRLNVIHSADISTVETLPGKRSSIAEIASVNGQEVIILDIDDLENRILSIHS